MEPESLQPYNTPEHRPFTLGEGTGAALLIHGFPGTPAEVRPLAQALSERGWKVRAPLLPGFGTDIPNLNLRRRKDWIGAAAEEWLKLQAQGESNLLVGYSMGAAVALHVAKLQPPDKLALISPFWRAPSWIPWLVPLARRFTPNLRLFNKADFNDERLRQMFATIIPEANLEDPEVQAFIRERFILPLAAMEEVLRMGRNGFRIANRIRSTTLIIQGAHDPLVRAADTKHLARRMKIPQENYIELDASHDLLAPDSPQLEQVKRLLIQFAGAPQEQGLPLEMAAMAESQLAAEDQA